MRPAMKDLSAGHLPIFDGLRGVAALAVALYHIPGFTGRAMVPHAYLAVDMFFCMSGFLLWRVYADRLRGGMTTAEFMIRRLIRLYPLYLLSGLACFAYLLMFHAGGIGRMDVQAYAANLLLVPLPKEWTAQAAIYPLNFAAWSILVELGLSLLFAVILPIIAAPRHLAIVIAGSAMALVISGVHYSGLNLGDSLIGFPGGIARGLFSFFVGVAVARIAPELDRSPHGNRWNGSSFFVLMVLLLTLLILNVTGIACLFYDLGIVMIVFPAMVLMAARREIAGPERSMAHALGGASYAVYIFQAPFAAFAAVMLNGLGMHPAPWLGFALVAALFWFGSVINRHVDGPVRKWLIEACNRADTFCMMGRPKPVLRDSL